jgi:lipoprotein-releasing system permease protein
VSIEKFIADKITGGSKDKANISKPIVKIAVTGIVLGVAVMLITISIVIGFKSEISRKITGLTTHIAISSITMNPGNEPLPITISEDTLNKLRTFPGVKHIQVTAFKNAILKTELENEGVVLKGVDSKYDFTFIKEHLKEGRLPEFSDSSASKDVLISKALSDKLALNLNDKMQLYFLVQHEIFDSVQNSTYIKSEQRSRKLTVCGIFKTDFSDFDNNLTFVDLKQIQKLNYWNDNTVGTYEISLKNFDDLQDSKAVIEEALGYQYYVRSVKDIYQNIFIWLDKLDINGVIIVVLMIIVAVINMITALLILILERTNMVGLVKSLGMSNFSVRKVFFHVSMKLIGRGLLWGNIVGIGFCYIQYYFELMKLDAETYYVDHVVVDINWFYYLLLNAGTFIVCLCMLYFPSLIITKLTPIKTLRFD